MFKVHILYSEDLETIRTMFSQLLKEDNMKHIDYKTFNSVQAIGQNPTEDRYNVLQEKVAQMVDTYWCSSFLHISSNQANAFLVTRDSLNVL